ncbi:MAG: hypothetical protein VB125_00590, partial [Burkholderia sp.]
TDLAVFSQVELDDIAWKMNTRPRKSLGWKCPAELFMPESFDVRQHHHEIVTLGMPFWLNALLLHFDLEIA